MTILSGVKLKFYPNKKQKQTIEQTFGNSRFVWNQFKNMQENRYNAMIDDYNSYKNRPKKTVIKSSILFISGITICKNC